MERTRTTRQTFLFAPHNADTTMPRTSSRRGRSGSAQRHRACAACGCRDSRPVRTRRRLARHRSQSAATSGWPLLVTLVFPFAVLFALATWSFYITTNRDGAYPILPGRNSDAAWKTRQAASLHESKMDSSHHDPERRRQHFDRTALQRQHLAVYHHIHWPVELKLDAPHRVALRQRMTCVCAIVERRQVPDQPQSPNRPPADILD